MRKHACRENGFAMAALLVVLAIMGLMLSMALPVWHHAAQREREAELIFRGEQYARAIMLYQRRTPGAYPPDVETLLEGRFLRRAYRDPMTADGEFRFVLQSELAAAGGPGGGGGASSGAAGEEEAGSPSRQRQRGEAGERPGFMQGVRPFGGRGENEPGGVDGNIAGVASRSEKTSIALYGGKSKYSEWVFVNAGPEASAGAATGQPGQPPLQPGLSPPPGGPADRTDGGMGGLRQRLGSRTR